MPLQLYYPVLRSAVTPVKSTRSRLASMICNKKVVLEACRLQTETLDGHIGGYQNLKLIFNDLIAFGSQAYAVYCGWWQ